MHPSSLFRFRDSEWNLSTFKWYGDDIKILKMFNPSTTVGVDISYDGVTKHDYWPPGATLIIDLQTNHADNSAYGAGTLYGRKGQIIWGRTSSTSAQLQIAGYR